MGKLKGSASGVLSAFIAISYQFEPPNETSHKLVVQLHGFDHSG